MLVALMLHLPSHPWRAYPVLLALLLGLNLMQLFVPAHILLISHGPVGEILASSLAER